MSYLRVLRNIAVCGVACLFSVAGSATSIPITFGAVQFGFATSLGDFDIRGPGMDLFQGTPDGPAGIANCAPGAVCDISIGIGSTATFCTYCAFIYSSGTLGDKVAAFLAPSLMITGSAFYSGGDTLSMPISISGTVVGYALNCPPGLDVECTLGPVEFSLAIVGTGTGTLVMTPGGYLDVYGIGGKFTGTATIVPEPMSLLLTGTGLAGVWIRRRKIIHTS